MFAKISELRRRIVEATPALSPGHKSYPWLVLLATSIATFMAVLDSTIVNVALSKLTVAFGVSTDSMEWVLTGYMLAFGVMLPASGWLADRFGYKATFVSGIFLFTLGSFAASMSWDLGSLVLFRVVQALGGGMVMPVGMAIITREFPPEKRGLALGFWSISSAASASLGPTIGGYLIDNYSWHTIFDVNVPIGAIGIAAGALILREHKSDDSKGFDFVGFISMAVFLCGLNLALADGNAAWNTDGWRSDFILCCFGLSALGLIVFLVNELGAEHPLIDLRLFRDRDFGLSSVVLFIFGLGMFGSTFLLPLYLQSALGYTPLQSGLVFLPMGVLTAIASPIAGALSDRIGGKIPLAFGLMLMAASLFVNRYLSLSSETAQIMVPVIMRGFGMGFIFTPLSSISISQIPPVKMAQASGLANVLRQIGGSVGVAVFGSILTHQQKIHMAGLGQLLDSFSPSFKAAVVRLSDFAMQASGGGAAQAAGKAQSLLMTRVGKLAFVSAMGDAYTVAAIVTLASVVPILLMKESRRRAAAPRVAPSE